MNQQSPRANARQRVKSTAAALRPHFGKVAPGRIFTLRQLAQAHKRINRSQTSLFEVDLQDPEALLVRTVTVRAGTEDEALRLAEQRGSGWAINVRDVYEDTGPSGGQRVRKGKKGRRK